MAAAKKQEQPEMISIEELAFSKLLCYTAMQFPAYQIGKMHEMLAEYLEAVERGDIMRLIVLAPPRHGKCCSENTLIHMADGSLQKAKYIEIGSEIFGYDNGRLCTQTIIAKETAKKLSTKITTQTGLNFIGSNDHPLLTYNGYKELSDLSIKDFMVTLRREMNFVFDQVVKIEEVGIQDLIHLQTTGSENYIGNGIVSHNTALVSEFFPAWFLGRNPDKHIISCSYSQTRANDVGRKVRNQLDDRVHRSIFPNCQIADDMKSIQHFSTNQNGEYFSMGVGGSITGRGAHCVEGDTVVNTELGKMKIVDIIDMFSSSEQEIKVLSVSDDTGDFQYHKVLAVMESPNDTIHTIITDTGHVVRSTGDHKFFVQGIGYIDAKDLHIGNRLIYETIKKHLPRIQTAVVISITVDSSKIERVYDIQVEQNNNFFANGILVHNCFLIDDALKDRASAESVLERKKLQTWYRGVAYTRLMIGGRIVIINTRWHEDDLSGWLLREHASEGWVVLNMPAIAEDNDMLGRKRGEVLWPEAYPLKTLETIKNAIGSYEWNSQYQQRPVSAEGSIIKHEWLRKYDSSKIPSFQKIVLSCDTAFKATELADPTAILVWGVTKTEYYLLDILCRRMEFHELKNTIAMMYQKWSASACLVEDRSSGQSLIQEFKRISPIPVIPIKTMNIDKVTRFSSVSHYFEGGNVLLPTSAPWLVDYETQITTFPYDKHDDMVDATSQFLLWAAKPRYSVTMKPLFWK